MCIEENKNEVFTYNYYYVYDFSCIKFNMPFYIIYLYVDIKCYICFTYHCWNKSKTIRRRFSNHDVVWKTTSKIYDCCFWTWQRELNLDSIIKINQWPKPHIFVRLPLCYTLYHVKPEHVMTVNIIFIYITLTSSLKKMFI